jgi:hypothetical protein
MSDLFRFLGVAAVNVAVALVGVFVAFGLLGL